MITVGHFTIAAGFTHASSVIFERSSEFESATVIQSLTPSNESAPLYLPAVVQAGPLSVPGLPLPDTSGTNIPLPVSNEYAATMPGARAFCTVTPTGAA